MNSYQQTTDSASLSLEDWDYQGISQPADVIVDYNCKDGRYTPTFNWNKKLNEANKQVKEREISEKLQSELMEYVTIGYTKSSCGAYSYRTYTPIVGHKIKCIDNLTVQINFH